MSKVDVVSSEELRITLTKIVHDAMDDWGAKMGFDIKDPLDQQADMRHLRKWRNIVEGSSMRALTTTVGVFVTGVLGLLWLTITGVIKR